MRIDAGHIAKALDGALKGLPTLENDGGEWQQTGWTVSTDMALRDLSSPLVRVGIFEFWTKIVQTRANGWPGDSFHVLARFDDQTTAEQVAQHIVSEFRAGIERARQQKDKRK